MSFWGRTAGHPDDMCLGTPIHFSQCGAGIWADIVTDNILYPILDVRLDDVGYGSRTDSIAVGKLGMDQAGPLSFVQLKQYLATFQYSLTGLLITDCFLKYGGDPPASRPLLASFLRESGLTPRRLLWQI